MSKKLNIIQRLIIYVYLGNAKIVKTLNTSPFSVYDSSEQVGTRFTVRRKTAMKSVKKLLRFTGSCRLLTQKKKKKFKLIRHMSNALKVEIFILI